MHVLKIIRRLPLLWHVFSFLSERGFNEVKIEHIAKEANVSQVTIYNHFGSKDALFRELIQEFITSEFQYYKELAEEKLPFHRNEQIQILCEQLKEYYHDRIYKRVKELGLLESIPYNRIWETDTNHVARKSGHIIHESTLKRSHLFPIPYSYSKTEHS
ncbi:TetR/AcrR family transcriptional regulator, partial [Bacillus sp. D-CC]